MWMIKWLLAALLIAFVIGFAMQNTGQMVTVSFLHWQSGSLHLWSVMYLAFAIGLFTWLVVSIFQTISLRAENTRIGKEVSKLHEELDRLRNISVEESIVSLNLTKVNSKDGEV